MLRRSFFFRGAAPQMPNIVYTYTDEAPALATHALLPIFQRFLKPAGVNVVLSDISVANRVLAQFGLDNDNLSALGKLAQDPNGYIIKLPNVSASLPQLLDAIKELQSQGYKLPDYPADSSSEVAQKYAKALGSSVNPVLREGNSDRHCTPQCKAFGQKFPTKLAPWSGPQSKTHVAHMGRGDFYESERSYIVPKATSVRIEHTPEGSTTAAVLKKGLKLEEAEVIDASFLSVSELRAFFEREFQDAKEKDILTSLHLKATMMKVSDPIMFGHAVEVFYRNAFEKYGEKLAKIGAKSRNGLASVLDTIKNKLPADEAKPILEEFERAYALRSKVAMVDAGRGITNFHVPSDIIIDASMPPMIRDGGRMWNKDDKLQEVKCIVPDRCYATQYAAIVDNCKQRGAFNAATMGQVSNIGLMAKKAEEYGSHDKTFELPSAGTVRVVDENSGEVIFEHSVGKGDIWRMCQTKDVAIKDWVELAYKRAIEWNHTAIFWLDSNRAHDANIIKKVMQYSGPLAAEARAKGVDVSIMSPQAAARVTCDRARKNLDTISVTGNVMRDYNTDMFPILTLGTSSRMLSIVPFLNGGGMYETGAGGSAPKHVQQLVKENHLRWDSLGEYQAVAACLLDMGRKYKNELAVEFGESLDAAIGEILNTNCVPGRKAKELDNRGCHFYLALYWAKEAAKKRPAEFTKLAQMLDAEKDAILKELIDVQGPKVDIGGYYRVEKKKTDAIMNPSAKFNEIITKY